VRVVSVCVVLCNSKKKLSYQTLSMSNVSIPNQNLSKIFRMNLVGCHQMSTKIYGLTLILTWHILMPTNQAPYNVYQVCSVPGSI
jgi:hypothetical protein